MATQVLAPMGGPAPADAAAPGHVGGLLPMLMSVGLPSLEMMDFDSAAAGAPGDMDDTGGVCGAEGGLAVDDYGLMSSAPSGAMGWWPPGIADAYLDAVMAHQQQHHHLQQQPAAAVATGVATITTAGGAAAGGGASDGGDGMDELCYMFFGPNIELGAHPQDGGAQHPPAPQQHLAPPSSLRDLYGHGDGHLGCGPEGLPPLPLMAALQAAGGPSMFPHTLGHAGAQDGPSCGIIVSQQQQQQQQQRRCGFGAGVVPGGAAGCAAATGTAGVPQVKEEVVDVTDGEEEEEEEDEREEDEAEEDEQEQAEEYTEEEVRQLGPRLLVHPRLPELIRAVAAVRKVALQDNAALVAVDAAAEAAVRQVKAARRQAARAGLRPQRDPRLDSFMAQYLAVCEAHLSQLIAFFEDFSSIMRDFDSRLSLHGNGSAGSVARAGASTGEGAGDGRQGHSGSTAAAGSEGAEGAASGASCGGAEAGVKGMLKRKFQAEIQQLREEFSKRKKSTKLPDKATATLKKWFNANFVWPYPPEDDKRQLGLETGLDATQVNNWFINQRKRHWIKLFPCGQPSTREAAEAALKAMGMV